VHTDKFPSLCAKTFFPEIYNRKILNHGWVNFPLAYTQVCARRSFGTGANVMILKILQRILAYFVLYFGVFFTQNTAKTLLNYTNYTKIGSQRWFVSFGL
jgi:hypothetical protein